MNHENIDELLSRVLLVVPEYVDNRGAVDVKTMKRVLRMMLQLAASCVLHTAHICIPNTDYVPLMCYMLIPVTTVYAGFPCIRSPFPHIMLGEGAGTLCAFTVEYVL